MYLSHPSDDLTQLNAVSYDHTTNTTNTVSFNMTGDYEMVGANLIGYDCAVFRNLNEFSFTMVSYNETTESFTEMSDILPSVQAVTFDGYPKVKIGKSCQAFALNSHVWKMESNSWVKVNTTGLKINAFD